ncbi:MAG: ATP-binding protein [Chloroflexi bacterium]|nr:MAG: ATP-binding protein [Chloroflexota bacterium]
MTKIRRGSGAATAAQTRAYAMRPEMLASQLRAEIATVPATPHGRPALIVVMGLPGVGKSHCARLLSGRLGAAHVASDELRSRLFIAPSYADEENRAIFAAVTAILDNLLSEGHRVVVDATNLIARNRAGTVAVARSRGVPVVYVRVTASDEDARARLASRRAGRATGDHSEADESIYERMRAQPFEPPQEGFLELVNGPDLANEIDRIVSAVEAAS